MQVTRKHGGGLVALLSAYWLSLGIKVSLLLTGFAFARSAWPSRLGRLVLSGALVLLVAGIVTFFLHDSFAGYQGLEERLWAFVARPGRWYARRC